MGLEYKLIYPTSAEMLTLAPTSAEMRNLLLAPYLRRDAPTSGEMRTLAQK